MMTPDEIEFAANIHRQISEKVDVSQPMPQEIEIFVPMNFVVKKRISNFVLYANE